MRVTLFSCIFSTILLFKAVTGKTPNTDNSDGDDDDDAGDDDVIITGEFEFKSPKITMTEKKK